MLRRIVWVLAILALGLSLGAQEISEKKDIAIFALNYYGAPVTSKPGGSLTIESNSKTGEFRLRLEGSGSAQTDGIFQQALGSIDAQIRQVFVSLNRFNVIGLPQRLTDADVQSFIDTIRDYKERNVEIPEEVSFGQVAFTEADFNRLVGAFYVVIPSVIRYDQVRESGSKVYETEIVTSFSIIDVESYRTISSFQIETYGSDENASRSMQDAVDSIPLELDFNLRSIQEFRLRTAVIEIAGSDIYIQLGRNLGVMLGEEYRVVRFAERAGFQSERPFALLEIKEVDEEYSIARVIYADQPIVIGDQVVELPRIGFTLEPFFNIGLLNLVHPGEAGIINFGLRTAVNRGFYGFRPTGGLEMIIDPVVEGPPLFGLFLGGEFNLNLGRLRPHLAFDIAPVMSINFEDIGDDDTPFDLTHLKAAVKGRVAFLVADSVEVFAEAGLNYGIPITVNDAIGGIFVGAGVIFK